MKLLYFAWVREKTGISEEDVDLPEDIQTVAQLIDWLIERGPEFASAFENRQVIRAAINQEHVKHDEKLANATEVAFFSTGDRRLSMIRVQTEDFDINQEIKDLTADRFDIGAVVSFTGLVRDMAKGQVISEMQLEHYPGMTRKELEHIENEAHDRWPLSGTVIIHRYGSLQPGDNIVLVLAASAHRQAAFDAAAFIMDYLKTRATFWKKEVVDGNGDWVDAKEEDLDVIKRWD